MATQSLEGLGGNASEHAPKETTQTSDVNKIESFIRKGEEILDTFVSSIRAFEGQALKIQSLTTSVKEIQSDLKRKTSDDAGNEQAVKRARRTSSSCADLDIGDSSDDSDSDVEEIMSGPTRQQEKSEDTFFNEMDQFFEEEGTVTDAIKGPVADMVNKNIRRTKLDAQRLDKLVATYKRPENVDSLQVPKVDKFLWNQLKHHVRSADVARQSTIDSFNKVAGPLVTAMDHCYNNERPDTSVLKQCIGDCFKLVCASVNKINLERREAIKKELDPRFRSLCSSDTPISATGLFGDNLQEQSKQLDASKQIKMTNKMPFLGQGRGSNQSLPQTTGQKSPHNGPRYRPLEYGPPKHSFNKSGKQQWKKNFSNRLEFSGRNLPKKNSGPQRKH